jgi:hypothetical protein
MGCRTSNFKESAVITIQTRKNTNIRSTNDNLFSNRDEPSEYSLRECSLIPCNVDLEAKRRTSDDPSIFGIIQEIS